MSSKDGLKIDLRQQGTSEVFFPQPPVSKSDRSSWSSLYVEHHRQPYHDFPEHQPQCHTIACSLSPIRYSGERWLDGRYYSYQREVILQGGIALIPSGVCHRSMSNQQSEFILLNLDSDYLNQVTQEWDSLVLPYLIPYSSSQPDPLLFQISLALNAEIVAGYPGGRLYGDSICNFLAVHLLKNYSNLAPKIPQYDEGLNQLNLRKVLDYINSFLDQDLSLEALAGVASISKYHFISLFKQSMGMTPHQYVIQQRIERARILLRDPSLSISEISLACGFTNQSHFTRLFRKHTGVTPKTYREQ
jgi:AraC family transcriptional regulator